jgi:hypothetical protein
MAVEQRRRFGKRPFEGGTADLFARGAQAFASGLLGTFDQAAVRDEVLYPGERKSITVPSNRFCTQGCLHQAPTVEFALASELEARSASVSG